MKLIVCLLVLLYLCDIFFISAVKSAHSPQKRSNNPEQISKQKCQEYAKIEPENPYCHQHGSVPQSKEYPHIALLGYLRDDNHETDWLCGGILVSEQYVITNGYCLQSVSHGYVRFVKLGLVNINDDTNTQLFNVTEHIAHPKYKKGSYSNDIGLLKLERPATLNAYVRPACLHTSSEVPFEKATLLGWGSTLFGKDLDDNLLKADQKLITLEECNRTYSAVKDRKIQHLLDGAVHVCATPIGQDICRGAGGPLQAPYTDVKCMYDVFGMASFGIGCNTGTPTVFTKISAFVPWIEQIIWPTLFSSDFIFTD